MTVNGHNWILEPKVHVLAAPRFFDHPEYKLPPGGTDSERLVAHGGKGCYDSYGTDGRGIKEHIESLRKSFHGSVFEHATFSLFLSGISRGCSHEIVRHRAGFSYSQRSTRFTKENEASFVLEPFYAFLQDLAFDDPSGMTMEQSALLNCFKMQCNSALEAYSRSVDWLMEMAPKEKNGVERRKWSRGKARQLLPHALETRMTMTGNIRSWRFFLEERSGAGAEPEIRRLANAVMLAIEPLAPFAFEDMMANQTVVDGYPVYMGVRKV